MKSFCLAVLAGGLLVASSGVSAEGREAVSLKVSTAGVDFGDPASVEQYRKEIARKIEEVCNPGDRVNADTKPDFECRREMAANFELTLHQLALESGQSELRRN